MTSLVLSPRDLLVPSQQSVLCYHTKMAQNRVDAAHPKDWDITGPFSENSRKSKDTARRSSQFHNSRKPLLVGKIAQPLSSQIKLAVINSA